MYRPNSDKQNKVRKYKLLFQNSCKQAEPLSDWIFYLTDIALKHSDQLKKKTKIIIFFLPVYPETNDQAIYDFLMT